MLITVNRLYPTGPGINGTMLIDGEPFCSTLERTGQQIPQGWYRVELNYSSRFQQILPLLYMVPGRNGIRIHAGNVPQDSSGCILVGKRQTMNQLTQSRRTLDRLISTLSTVDKKEEIYIDVEDYDGALIRR